MTFFASSGALVALKDETIEVDGDMTKDETLLTVKQERSSRLHAHKGDADEGKWREKCVGAKNERARRAAANG